MEKILKHGPPMPKSISSIFLRHSCTYVFQVLITHASRLSLHTTKKKMSKKALDFPSTLFHMFTKLYSFFLCKYILSGLSKFLPLYTTFYCKYCIICLCHVNLLVSVLYLFLLIIYFLLVVLFY